MSSRAFWRLASLLALGVLSGCTPKPQPAETPQSYALPPLPEMVELPGGSFLMGDQSQAGDADERPVHRVILAPFAIGQYEVTVEQYGAFAQASARPRPSGSPRQPVTNLDFVDARAYVDWLSLQTGKRYRLASEAEWEYAARAGALSLFAYGNAESELCRHGNVADHAAQAAGSAWQIADCDDGQVGLAEVGRYRPNAFGLYDMAGNAWEWIADCYRTDYAQAEPVECVSRVVRGGSYQQSAFSARASNRQALEPQTRSPAIGFRVVRQP